MQMPDAGIWSIFCRKKINFNFLSSTLEKGIVIYLGYAVKQLAAL